MKNIADCPEKDAEVCGRCLWIEDCGASSPLQLAADRLTRVAADTGVESPVCMEEVGTLPHADSVTAVVREYAK